MNSPVSPDFPPAAIGTRQVGQVKWFNNKAGYGFITMIGKDKEDVDIFTHYSTVSVTDSQYKYLVQGEYVEFELSESSNVHHQYQATNVKGINGGKLMCETRQTNRSVQNRPSSHPVSKTTSSIPKRRAPVSHTGAVKPEADGFTTVSRTRPQKRGTSVNIKTI